MKIKEREFETKLKHCHELDVRFSEVDSMGIVWHGNYVKYLEDGREAFGRKYELSYMDYYKMDLLVPIVHLSCDYKNALFYGDRISVETTFVNSPAAKIIYTFKIVNLKSKKVIATGRSVQVFLNKDRELLLTCPTFFTEWKSKHGII